MNTLIIFGEDWGKHPSSTQHIAKHIRGADKIVWINSVGMRAPKLSYKDAKRVIEKVLMMANATLFAPKRRLEDKRGTNCGLASQAKIHIINPVTLPWHNWGYANTFNKKQIENAIGPRCKNEKRTYWLSLPTAMSMIEPDEADALIYYCCDDFYALDGVDPAMTGRWEPQLVSRATMIFASSQALLDRMPSHKSHLLEHGVDFELFAKEVPKHHLLNTSRRVVGFYGSISNWLDYDLLFQLAKALDHCDFMFVGHALVDVSRLASLPNVYLVPAVAHHELPRFAQHWDVLLMPFVNNAQIQACNPLKLKEYLAAGRPIVSTDFPAVRPLGDLVSIAKGSAEYIELVANAVDLSDYLRNVLRTKQRQCVAKHDWSNKGAVVNYLLGFH